MTEWRSVPGWGDSYRVSSAGEVRSVDRVIATRIGPQRWKGRALKPFRPNAGKHNPYLAVRLSYEGQGGWRSIHSLVAAAFIGPRPEGLEVRHVDGDYLHNATSNLVYGTTSENALDSVKHGTHFNSAKTFCPGNHPYNEANTHIDKRGGRHCRKCITQHSRERRARAA